MSETKTALQRLLRRFGREAAAYEKWAKEQYGREAFQASMESEAKANALRWAQSLVRDELNKVKP